MHGCHKEQLCNRTVRVAEFSGRIFLCKDYEGVKNRKVLKETLSSLNNSMNTYLVNFVRVLYKYNEVPTLDYYVPTV
jgi:hypothetical protein